MRRPVAFLLWIMRGVAGIARRSQECQMRKKTFSLFAVVAGMALQASTVLAQGGILSGRVTDSETGDPIASASVVLDGHVPMGRTEPGDAREERTNDNGEYTMLGLPSGQWNLTVEAEGYEPQPGVVTVRFGRNAPVNLRMDVIPHPLLAELDPALFDGMNRAERNAYVDGIQAELDAVAAARQNEDWETALAGSRALLERFPTIFRLHTDVGEALTRLDRFAEAIEAYEAAAAADPALRSLVDTTIARLRAATGDTSAVESLIASGDAAREDYYNLGTAAFGRGETDEAAEWFERAAAADPGWVLPVYQLGLVSLNEGDIEGAKVHFARAAELDPNSAEGQQAQAILGSLP